MGYNEPDDDARGRSVDAPLSTTQMRTEYASALCDPGEFDVVDFPGDGRVWSLSVERTTVPAWEAFAAVMAREGYLFRESAGGTYNCRQISGSSSYSLHAYALCIDLNPSRNGPQGTDNCDQPQGFIDGIKALRTVSGRQIFAWGGDWSPSSQDPMHWQIGATRNEIASGVIDPGEEDEMKDEDFQRIRGIMEDVVDDRLRLDDEQTSAFSRSIWKHVGTGKTGTATMLRSIYNTVTGKTG